MWKKIGRVRHATDDNIVWHVLCVWWVVKVSDTRSVCVTLIAFPQQGGCCECVRMLFVCAFPVLLIQYNDTVSLWNPWHPHLFIFKSLLLLGVPGCFLPLLPFWKVPCLWTHSPGQLNAPFNLQHKMEMLLITSVHLSGIWQCVASCLKKTIICNFIFVSFAPYFIYGSHTLRKVPVSVAAQSKV
jgi:hypothetical protein